MQPAGTGSEIDVARLAASFSEAIPQAGAAEDAFFAIEIWDAIFTARDGLARTHFDAQFRFAVEAELRPNENYVIGISGLRLNAAAHEQSILLRDQQFSVERNFGPATAGHDLVVKGNAAGDGVVFHTFQFG
jgi:hypothetical protein